MKYSIKKTFPLICVLLFCAILLTGCKHEHEWAEATCTQPKTCVQCGETLGDALGHDWADATCTKPVTCSRCGATAGNALGHRWEEATCTSAKKCLICGAEDGVPLGHEWVEATHEAPKTCSRCGETEGNPLLYDIPPGFTKDHMFADFDTFNSYAYENGLGDTLIWFTGKYSNISLQDTGVEDQTVMCYVATMTDADGHEWLVNMDLDAFSTIDKYTALYDHSLCIIGKYLGYSDVFQMPVVLLDTFYDQTTGNMTASIWYQYL